MDLDDDDKMTEEERQLRREQCLSRHDSIRTQANIQLLDEKINLIGSLKAHREYCQTLETTLQTLEDQAIALPQVPQEMIGTIKNLKKVVLSTVQYPGKDGSEDEPMTLPLCSGHSESDLSLCEATGTVDLIQEDEEEVAVAADKFGDGSNSNHSSSHSMSLYGYESPIRTILLPNFQPQMVNGQARFFSLWCCVTFAWFSRILVTLLI